MNDLPGIVHSRFDNLFKSVVSGGWANSSDGDVEAPTGYFAVVNISQDERGEFIEAFVLDFPEANDLPAGNYFTVENSDGIIVVWDHNHAWESIAKFEVAQRDFAQWSGESDPIPGQFTPEKQYLVCNICGEAFDEILTASGHTSEHDDIIDWRIVAESEAL